MSLETEAKKIANNLQQLTDAIVTQTAAIEGLVKAVNESNGKSVQHGQAFVNVDDNIAGRRDVIDAAGRSGVTDAMGTTDSVGHTAEAVATESAHTADTVEQQGGQQQPAHQEGVTGDPMTMADANLRLQAVAKALGDGGAAVRSILAGHNAITLAQIPPEQYAAVVAEVEALSK